MFFSTTAVDLNKSINLPSVCFFVFYVLSAVMFLFTEHVRFAMLSFSFFVRRRFLCLARPPPTRSCLFASLHFFAAYRANLDLGGTRDWLQASRRNIGPSARRLERAVH